MKILFVLEYYFPHIGGVETLFKSLCEGLVKKGHKVKVVTMQIEGTKGNEIVNGVDITRIPFPNRYLFTFLSFFDVLRLAKGVDIIVTTTYNGAPPA